MEPVPQPTPALATPNHFRRLVRVVFTTFLLTFIASRVLVILIMERKLPDFFLHLGGTHVHHLNYGIFLLSAVGGVLLLLSLNDGQRLGCAVAYGIGMALTFDEFGMWVHLGGGYWQRASFDAVIVILGLLGMLAFAPPWQKIRAHHVIMGGGTILVTILFYLLLFKSLNYVDRRDGAGFQRLELNGPQ